MNRIAFLLFALIPVLAGAKPADPTPEQRIDELVEAGLASHDLKPNALINDEEFLRRVYLNIAGRIPTIEEAEAFHTMEYPNKREQLIQQLLDGEGYVSAAYHFWADILRVTDRDGAVSDAYQIWLKDALRQNKPYDQIVRELVTAQGKIWDNGATGYYFRDRGMPLDNMSNTIRVFLGVRLECAQCHDHPFDKWTQMDYYKMAAFTYGVNTKDYDSQNRDLLGKHMKEAGAAAFQKAVSEASGIDNFPRVGDGGQGVDKFLASTKAAKFFEANKMSEERFREIAAIGAAAATDAAGDREGMRAALKELYNPLKYISISESPKQVQLPHDYKYANAKPGDVVTADTMFGAKIDLTDLDSALPAYAEWMTSPENPTFTRVIANRLWKEAFGAGIIEPVDEITDQTQPSNPQLLAYLEDLMREMNYDIKGFLKIIYNTRAYQRAANGEELIMGEPYYFQGPVLRRMSAEQMWDSVVALALPEADHYKPSLKGQLSNIEKQRRIYASLEERPFEEYLAMVKEIAPLTTERYAKEEEARNRLMEAQKAGDDSLYAELRRELKSVGKGVNDKIAEIGYIYLKEKVDADDLLAALGMNEVSAGRMDSDTPNNAVVTSLPKVEFPDMPADLPRAEKKIWANQQKADYNVYRSLISGMARASELPSPAPRGHFLRDFGQSDREVIENAADNASVPQALNLLNGNIVEALTNKFSVFGRRIQAAGDSEEKTRMIFQAMLTREPTDDEMKLVQTEIETNGEESYEGIVWALLNTQQFMFVQ